MNVLLVEPPRGQWFMFGDVVGPNTGYAQLMAYLEQEGFAIEVLDCPALGIGWEDFVDHVKARNPDVVGIGAAVCWAPSALKAFRLIHEALPRVTLVAGGLHFTFTADEVLTHNRHISYIVRGEGEVTFAELLAQLRNGTVDPTAIRGLSYAANGRVIHNEPRPFVEDLDSLPMPAYHKLPMDRYHFRNWPPFMVITSSRGCPYQCTFCAQWKFYGQTWRGVSAKRLADEIELLYNRYGIRVIEFGDDNFNINRQRNIEFLEELKRRHLKIGWMMESRVNTIIRDQDLLPAMKEQGLFYILFGAESGINGDLEYFKKEQTVDEVKQAMRILKRNGIDTITCFVLGARHQTQAALKQTVRYAKELDPTVPVFTPLTPFPGTTLYEEAREKGWLTETDWSKFDLAHPIIGTETVSPDELGRIVRRAYLSFYMNPRRFLKRLFSRNWFVREGIWAGITRKIKFSPPKKKTF